MPLGPSDNQIRFSRGAAGASFGIKRLNGSKDRNNQEAARMGPLAEPSNLFAPLPTTMDR